MTCIQLFFSVFLKLDWSYHLYFLQKEKAFFGGLCSNPFLQVVGPFAMDMHTDTRSQVHREHTVKFLRGPNCIVELKRLSFFFFTSICGAFPWASDASPPWQLLMNSKWHGFFLLAAQQGKPGIAVFRSCLLSAPFLSCYESFPTPDLLVMFAEESMYIL